MRIQKSRRLLNKVMGDRADYSMRDFLEKTIKAAGELTLEYRSHLETVRVNHKSAKDLVTEADVAVEKFICEKIKEAYPSHAILGEETGKTAGDDNLWIIDPIDGTTSFVYHQPFYSVSIALQQGREITLGAVYAPVLGELFIASKGGGAFLNGKRISVSDCQKPEDSLLATGFACLRSDHEDNNLPVFNKLMPIIRGVRRFGSAAVDMCYVGCGRLDGFWEFNLNIYDIAAGKIVLEEAGGRCSDFSGGQEKLCSEVLATNGKLHKQISDMIMSVRD
ncbi:MAG: inositol monophosphatase family protein [Sedimentisphaeraceae bacterium JB056]